MKPYYEHAGITIYHGDCRDMGEIMKRCDLLATDPPYGMSDKTRRASRNSRTPLPNSGRNAHSYDWEEIYGDDAPFDPAHLLDFDKAVIFGANHFSSRLPDSRCWLVWDKRDGTTSDDCADCEFAWTNLDKPARLHRHLWRGLIRRGEENAVPIQHPHQKPVGVMQWVIKQCNVTGHELLLDPYMGSGTTLSAAKRMGIAAIGIEIEEKYCEIAAKRLSQEVFNFPDQEQASVRVEDPEATISGDAS